jgi:hypothetical protein
VVCALIAGNTGPKLCFSALEASPIGLPLPDSWASPSGLQTLGHRVKATLGSLLGQAYLLQQAALGLATVPASGTSDL